MVGAFPSLCMCVNNKAAMEDLAPFCANPWLWPRPCSSPFGLSLHSQSQSSPQVCLLKPMFQHLGPMHTTKACFQLESTARWLGLSLRFSLCSTCRRSAAALSPESLKFPICPD